ncbi:MAG: hypothetical protein SRB2_03322 [Desulfobacteraceae bacterium Eth-SRB2]|nr:MAG: hypothetical protein SRB2_03322 [Desulfobacteraceae bacterium Eth-SRB2]
MDVCEKTWVSIDQWLAGTKFAWLTFRMLEYWNNGFWNAGAIVYWENEPDKNIKKQGTSFKKYYTDIPTFHYSMCRAKTQIS